MIRLAACLTLTLFSLLALSACLGGVRGSGVRKTEQRDLAPFTAIEATGAFDVEVVCQKSASFEIEGDDNILPLVETEVRGNTLRLTTSRAYSSNGGIVVRISMPNLEAVRSTGAGKFKIKDVKNDRFKIDSTGAATVVASGQSKSLDISSTGAGKIDANDLQAGEVSVKVTGAARVEVYATDQLDVTVSGAGRVIYSGNPKVTKHISGAGEVTKKESGV
jgi:Putative auto-transporter adhesin, head GIN domain